MINTLVPPGCAVRLIDLPYNVDELVSVDEDGFASIYLNARHSYEKQKRSLKHALRHLEGDDFHNDKDIRTIEHEADGKQPPRIATENKPRYTRQQVYNFMRTLNRIGLTTEPDPLLMIKEEYL